MIGVRRPASAARPVPRPRVRPSEGWGFLAPALLVLLAMTVAPAAYLFYSSLFSGTLLGGSSHFIGLQNYTQLLSDSEVINDAAVTVKFVFVAVGIELALGLTMALILNRKMLEKGLLTALFVLPLGVTPVVSALVFRHLADPNFGWVDYYLQQWHLMGADPVAWLSDPFTAWIAMIALDVWQWTPFVALILLAGLQAIPHEPVEAAMVDGASPLQIFRYVTLPMLRPFIAIALLLRMIDAFKTFGTVQILTGGGPGTSTEVINLYIYRVALQDFNTGAAAAIGVCFLLALSIIVPQLLRVLSHNSDIVED